MRSLALSALACAHITLQALAGEPEVLRKWEFHSPADAAGWVAAHHVKDLTVSGDRLRMSMTGTDAFVFLPPVDVPMDGCRVRVRIRCDRPCETQIYWLTTGQSDFGEQQKTSEHTPASEHEPVTLQFNLGSTADAGKRITALRIDPCNGNTEGTVEIASVEVLRVAPVLDVNFSFTAAQVGIGEKVSERLSGRQTEGASRTEPLAAEFADGGRQELRLAPASRPAGEVTKAIEYDRAGVHRASAALVAGNDRYELDSAVIVGRGEHLPLKPALRSPRVRLDLVPLWDNSGYGAARWQVADSQGRWRECGWLLPLAEVAFEQGGRKDTSRKVQRVVPTLSISSLNEQAVNLEGQADGWGVVVRLSLVTRGELEAIESEAELKAPAGGRLLSFSGPVFRAQSDPAGDPLQRCGIFGGLEFLEPGWRSSSDRAVGPKFADRWSPHPFKITLPVMAVEAAGITTALMWDPRQRGAAPPPEGAGAGAADLPIATFASPNFIDGQSNHLMKLSAPSAHTRENESLAREPLSMNAGQKLAIKSLLYAEADLPVVYTSKRWYELFGPVTAPPMPHDDKSTYDLIARNFGETMYWPAEKGWTHHWYFPESPHWDGMMAGELVAHSLTTGEKQYVQRTGQAGKAILDVLGPAAAHIPDASWARGTLAAMRADGTFAFHNTEKIREQTREWTRGQFDSLGEENSTSLGTCVQAGMPIIRQAQLTGEPEFVNGMNRLLEAMSRFRVPRGAQVWEVHQEIPDIRAAALAVEAFRIGYEVTGERRWLDQASYWAWTGVPFVYSWHVPIEDRPGTILISRERKPPFAHLHLADGFENPQRQVTPYGVVPVLGPTFYVHNWFGVLVQWCGLEWALKVIELDRVRPDLLLRSIADGVVASGFQQTLDRPPWVGLYPDSWDLQANRAQPAYISSTLSLECLRAAGRMPPWTESWTRVVVDEGGQRRWHVTGWGRPVTVPPPQAGSWSAVVAFPRGQPNELIVANVEAPRLIRVGNDLLQHLEKPEPRNVRGSGWWYYPEQRALVMHFTQADEHTPMKIEW